eukprot:969716-Pelagomonas_calceolata.AAC.3
MESRAKKSCECLAIVLSGRVPIYKDKGCQAEPRETGSNKQGKTLPNLINTLLKYFTPPWDFDEQIRKGPNTKPRHPCQTA